VPETIGNWRAIVMLIAPLRLRPDMVKNLSSAMLIYPAEI
jgi:hypothetical protein